ncbi:unnamed protein product [Echinostoma caproni]|uniref:Uncharacterized protein n=1 Tax=Echinostoma caproni TaxID=27848 RepID=A0A3P8HTB0_9TREM|nr:unnamed protein product [Echinostoma caproni]
MCSSFLDPNTVAASAYFLVRMLDLRMSPEQQSRCLAVRHQKAILCMDAPNERRMFASDCADRNLAELRAGGDQLLSTYASYSSLSSISNSDPGYDQDVMDPNVLLTSLESVSNIAQPTDSQVIIDLSSGDQVNALNAIQSDPNMDGSGTTRSPSQDSPGQNNMLLYTGSDDHFLHGWDLRFPSKPVVKHQFQNYPRKMSLMDNSELWVAEPPGRIHVFDIRHGALDCVYVSLVN